MTGARRTQKPSISRAPGTYGKAQVLSTGHRTREHWRKEEAEFKYSYPAALDRRIRTKRPRAARQLEEKAVVAVLTQGQRDSDPQEKNTINSVIIRDGPAQPVLGTNEEQDSGHGTLGFPALRRPKEYRRSQITTASDNSIEESFNASQITIGPMDGNERREILRLLYTWRDLFVTDVRDIPPADLIQHRIPTHSRARSRTANPQLYTPEEEQYQREMIPKLVEAGVIVQCDSPWAARTKFPRRKSGKLQMVRMVHVFCVENVDSVGQTESVVVVTS
ncbi:MAG: hypothetical protein M1816_005590 [Peltula sp. TS41687]|nr:MAG: hypothetical protein M1816_005590 [Peltula sp. TS41687]